MAIKLNEAITGVINANNIDGDAFNDYFMEAINLNYEEYIKENGEDSGDDYMGDNDTYIYGFVMNEETGKYEEDENADISFIFDSNNNVVQVTRSKWVKMNCAGCSPCYPNQADLDSNHGNMIAYSFSADDVSEYGDKTGIVEVAQNVTITEV